MKKLSVLVLALAIAVAFCAGVYAANATKPLVRHVVLMKFKDGTTPEQLKEIEKQFAELKTKLDVVKDFEWGTDISPEKLSQGFTHCFFVTFADEAGRDAYLPSKPHQDFVKLMGPHLDKVLVIDYKPQM